MFENCIGKTVRYPPTDRHGVVIEQDGQWVVCQGHLVTWKASLKDLEVLDD